MDTEFPGVVARPLGDFSASSDYLYQTLRCNVDLLKLIQLGICFCDADGKPGEKKGEKKKAHISASRKSEGGNMYVAIQPQVRPEERHVRIRLDRAAAAVGTGF